MKFQSLAYLPFLIVILFSSLLLQGCENTQGNLNVSQSNTAQSNLNTNQQNANQINANNVNTSFINSNFQVSELTNSRDTNNLIAKIDEPIFGVTTDTLPNDDESPATNSKKFVNLVKAIDGIKLSGTHKPVVRINIDANDSDKLAHYQNAVRELKQHARVMVNLTDSHDMYNYKTVGEFEGMVNKIVDALHEDVSIWEIGNEVNGEWVGWETDKETGDIILDGKKIAIEGMDEKLMQSKRELVRDQIAAAYRIVAAKKDKDAKIALTLYYNADQAGHKCWDRPEYEMFKWTNDYITDELKRNLDYIFISFYEDAKDCPILTKDVKKDTQTWIKIFNQLSGVFNSPNPEKGKLGFGEFAPQCHNCEDDRSCCERDKLDYIPRYYKSYHQGIINAKVPKYIGGFFYWYFYQDMVESENRDAFEALKKVAKSF